MAIQKTNLNGKSTRWMIVGVLALGAFFASYNFALARNSSATAATPIGLASPLGGAAASGGGGGCCGGGGGAGAGAGAGAGGAAASGGGGCCGGKKAPASAQVPKAADVAGDVQRISVDLSKGYYDPSNIELKAGVPAEITFGQGGGCLAQVQSQELGFFEDLSSGPKTVKVPALQAGTYSFTCGMGMVYGSIVVK